MKKICVYCACHQGNNPAFRETAKELGRCLAENKIELVYGGSDDGLMGILAESVLLHGGKVTAVMPSDLKKRAGHKKGTELILVNSMDKRKAMQERKQKMYNLADAFIALPGGLGTMDEMFEMLTWSQLGYNLKPCGFLNVDGYYNHLLAFLNNAVKEGLITPHHRTLAYAAASVEELLEKFQIFQPELSAKF